MNNNAQKKKVISFKNVELSFGEKKVLKDITFDVYENEILTIAGPSGCGKSTILKLIIGLLDPDEGKIKVDAKNIGMAFQYPTLFNSMSVFDNIALALRETTKLSEKDIKNIVENSLKIVGLEGTEKFYPDELSGGMQKRAGIARTIALKPDVILYDEPSSGLDPQTASKLEKDMVRFRDEMNVTSVVVSHDMGTIQNVSDRILILDKGIIVWQGYLRDFLTDESKYPKLFRERLALKNNYRDNNNG